MKLLSANGPWLYLIGSTGLAGRERQQPHTRQALSPDDAKGKIERGHRSLKNRILLEHYYLPGELERQIDEFVTHYNARRYHESLNNLTPEDVWCGRGQSILQHRRKIKEHTVQLRKQLYWAKKIA